MKYWISTYIYSLSKVKKLYFKKLLLITTNNFSRYDK